MKRLRRFPAGLPVVSVVLGRVSAQRASLKGGRCLILPSAVVVLVLLGIVPAHAAVAQQVQSGTLTNAADGTCTAITGGSSCVQPVTISGVDPAKSFLIFETRHSSNRPVGSEVRGRFPTACANPCTTIEFVRVTNLVAPEPVPITIRWYVVTFSSGVNVQRGEVNQVDSVTCPNPLTTPYCTINVGAAQGFNGVASVNQAFVLWSKTPAPGDGTWETNDAIAGEITATNNLQFRSASLGPDHIIAWQVVEFTNPADINVQIRKIGSPDPANPPAMNSDLSPPELTKDLPALNPVDPNKTFVLCGLLSNATTTTNIGARMIRAQLIDSQIIRVDRAAPAAQIAGQNINEIVCQAIELKDKSTVWRGTSNFTSGAAQAPPVSLVPHVNVSRAIAFGSVQSGGGQNWGKSSYATDDIIGVSAATLTLSATQLTLDRTITLASPEADVGWFVVEFEQGDAKVLSGSYTGDGTDNRAIDVGFVPDFVIVKSDTAQMGVFRTSTMADDNAKEAAAATILTADLIQSFDSVNGGRFIIGSDARVNSNTVTYRWIAFKAGPGKMAVGTYTGDSPPSSSQAISGLGFSPELVFIMSAGANRAIHRSAASPNAHDFEFSGVTNNDTWVPSLDADGFTVGSDARANASGTVYHYVAWNEVPGYMDVGTYLGNGFDNQDQPTGFAPEYVIIKSTTTSQDVVHRPASLDQGVDSTMFFRSIANNTLRIKALLTDGFRRGTTGNVNTSGVTYMYYAWKRESQPFIVSGDYTGDGQPTQLITQLGFTPDVVIVKSGTGQTAVIRTSTMGVDASKPMVGNSGLTANLIVSLDSANGGGFTVGSDARVNSSGVSYYFIAFKAAAGTMTVGTYAGVSNVANPITGVGFSPELVFIMNAAAREALHRSSASTEAYNFANSDGVGTTTFVPSFNADGFTVDTNDFRVNRSGQTYHYIAWNEIPGEMDIGTYLGDSTPNRNITGVGFEPEYVIVRHPDAFYAVHHPASLGRSTDLSLHFDPAAGAAPLANEIQALQPDGFQVGTSGRVNDTGATMIYYAWKRPYVSALTAVRLTAFTATRYDRGVLAQWRTGYEIDNLGFHLYREVNGERTRVTRAMVAGSGLMAGQGTAVNAEQRYATWDLDSASADPSAVYWLEDLDFNGTSTWNGPVTPVDGGLQAPPDVPTSSALRDLGKRAKRRGKLFVTKGAQLERPKKSDRPAARTTATAETQAQRALAAQAAVKIGVDHPGWYRVTQPDLVAAGLDPHVDPQTLRLFVDGVEQAMTVTGAADGRVDAVDAIEFYGSGVDTPYTDTRTYWLVAGGRPGRRIVMHGATPRAGQTNVAPSFGFTMQQKERSIYFAALRNGEPENWFGAFIYEEPTDLTFDVSNLDPNGAAELEIALQGVTDFADVTPDHRVAVLVNGTEVGEVVFDGQSLGVQTFVLSAGTLTEGANTVTVMSRGGEADYSLVDVVRLRYAHTYRADADLLRFTAEGSGQVNVSGFANGAIRVIDITDPLAPEELRGAVSAESGLWTVTVRVPGQGLRTLLAFTEATVATPAFVRANAMTEWHAAANGADYVAITHKQFASSVTPLLERRTQNGLTVAHVDIEDVYDEFSFGEKTPQALKDFVSHTRSQWKKAPRFLLLVGDATMDPRDYAGFGDADFVPTKQVPMAQISLETASDDWFADADDNGLPELAVGRLSVRSAEQAEVMVRKTLEYEDGDGIGWSQNVLLVADQNDASSDFEQTTATLSSLVPSRFSVARVLSGLSGADLGRQQVLDAVNQGQLIVNYVGHGSVRVWGTEGNLQTSEDVAERWRNGPRLPFVVAMNCLNGLFHGIYDEESLAETLLRTSGGGAVAAWASSGLTDSTTQSRVNQELFRLLFGDPSLTIGEAVAAAKRAVTNRDVRRSWIFFGDPALRLKLIQKPAGPETQSSEASVAPAGASSTADGDAVKPSTVPSISGVRLSDWNGDDRDDVLLHAASGWRTVFSLPKGEHVQGGHWDTAWEVYPADLNGDRVQDMVLVDRTTGTMLHAINDGAGHFEFIDGLLSPEWQLQVADLDGDRIDDLLLTMPDFGFWYTLLSDGRGHFTYRAGSWAAASSITLGDFNGDRRADAFLYDPETGAWTVAFSNGAGDFTYAVGTWTAGWTVQRANVDGDHRADLLLYSPKTGAWAEWAAQEPGHFRVRGGFWKAGITVHAIEAKRDGRDDVLLYDPNSGEWTFVMTDMGDTKYLNGIWQPQLTIATGDLDGDGRTDLLLYDPLTGGWLRGLRNKADSFDFTPGQWGPGWFLALEP